MGEANMVPGLARCSRLLAWHVKIAKKCPSVLIFVSFNLNQNFWNSIKGQYIIK